jgi:MoaA/NifB/PqqE/SkfB family radical SAM enzyme
MILSEETFDQCMDVLDDCKNDPRLEGLSAAVFLMLKPKGNRNSLTTLTDPDKFKALMDKANELQIQTGFDSCSGPSTVRYFRDNWNKEEVPTIIQSVEPCESGLFSLYINVDGKAFPCSFTDDGIGGLDVVRCNDFSEVWDSETIRVWRETLQNTTDKCVCDYKDHCRVCPAFEIGTCR